MEEDIKLLEKIKITSYGTEEELSALEREISEEELNQIIKKLINKYKELRQKMLENRNLYSEQIEKAEKEIHRLRDKIDDLEMNEKEYERREKESDKNMVATLEESLKYCLKIKVLEEQNKEQEKIIELMAENIYNTSDTLNMLDIGKEINYDLEKLFNGIDDTEAIKIIIDYFRKKAKGE